MINNCLFCQIIEGKIPTHKLIETEMALAFRDINPQAPTHVLVIPKIHIESTLFINSEFMPYFEAMTKMSNEITKLEEISKSGYRWVINTGNDGGQTVNHLHLHVLGGRKLNWPPG